MYSIGYTIHRYIEEHYNVQLNRVRYHIESFLARETIKGNLDIVHRNGEQAFIISKKKKILLKRRQILKLEMNQVGKLVKKR